jgi:hypothetical protein
VRSSSSSRIHKGGQDAKQHFKWNIIWRAQVENKCSFFSWLLLQSKLPTSDRILRFNGQANPICTLCRTTPEKHLHMVAKCAYTKAVWQLASSMPRHSGSVLKRSNYPCRVAIDTQARRDGQGQPHTSHHLYTMEHLERTLCRRVSQKVAMLEEQLVVCIKNDILAYRQANRSVE